MKIKLVESSGHPFDTIRRNVEKQISSLSSDGFDFNMYRTIDKNRYETHYFGRYNGIPFTLYANTTHRELNNGKYDVFYTLYLDNKLIPLGAAYSKDKDDLYRLLKIYFDEVDAQKKKEEEEKQKKQQEEQAKQDEENKKLNALEKARNSILGNTEKKEEPTEEKLDEIKKEEKPKVDPRLVGEKIEKILSNYGVTVKYEDATVGPAVTQYEFSLSPGTRISDISNLSKEIAMGLSVRTVSISPVQGKTTLGIQVPNAETANVSLDEVLENSENSGVSVALGKDLNGNAVSADILKMQHVLIGGSTGSGKSACINSMICSIIQKYSPDQVKLILIDPKKVELSVYSSVPHLLMPIVTDPSEADKVLKEMVDEMQKRYSAFEKVHVKNIADYNNLINEYNKENNQHESLMPYIVIVIDELADLMQTAGKSVESSIQRITQLARAAGIHLIVATQRPSADVVTGVIKSNIASRIAFATPSSIDSRTILDQTGAEKLLGKGDMLFKPTGASNPTRIQGAYVSDKEVSNIVNKVTDEYKK